MKFKLAKRTVDFQVFGGRGSGRGSGGVFAE
jgi:hypothetical protein